MRASCFSVADIALSLGAIHTVWYSLCCHWVNMWGGNDTDTPGEHGKMTFINGTGGGLSVMCVADKIIKEIGK